MILPYTCTDCINQFGCVLDTINLFIILTALTGMQFSYKRKTNHRLTLNYPVVYRLISRKSKHLGLWVTKNVSPADSRLIIKTVDQTVHATSGRLAASFKETPDGIGRTCPVGTATFSAYPPPLRRAHTCKSQIICHGIYSSNMLHTQFAYFYRHKNYWNLKEGAKWDERLVSLIIHG